jgi:hypothetical protein
VFLSEKLPHKSSDSLGEFFSEYFGEYHLEVFLVIVGLSYMVGHMLFRQDIKLPDKKASSKRIQRICLCGKNAIAQSFAWLVWKCVFQLSGGISSRPS